MRKGILAVAAAGSVFAITAAGATGLTVTNTQDSGFAVPNSGAGAAITATSCHDAFSVTYNYGLVGVIDSVTVTDVTAAGDGSAISTACSNVALKVSPDNGSTWTWTGVTPTKGLEAAPTAVTLTATYAVANSTSVTTKLQAG